MAGIVAARPLRARRAAECGALAVGRVRCTLRPFACKMFEEFPRAIPIFACTLF